MTTIPFPNGGDDGVPPDKRTRTDKIIDKLYKVLPAASSKEILAKLRAAGLSISPATLSQTLYHLRKNANLYGWTIPHVKRGSSSEERRYLAILADRTGAYTVGEEYLVFIREGLKGTVSTFANMGRDEVSALRYACQEIRSRVQRERMIEYVDDLEYAAKKARILLRNLRRANGV